LSTELPPPQPSGPGAVRVLTTVWLVISQAVVLGVGLFVWVSAAVLSTGARVVATVAKPGGTPIADAAVEDFVEPILQPFQPLMELTGAGLMIVLFGVVGSWVLWAHRRHGWASLVSSIPLLNLVYRAGLAITLLAR
jgi:hypothetical protein